MHTPHIEALATRSVVFERTYVSVALCMPSRTALLTSRRPDTSRSWTIEGDQVRRKLAVPVRSACWAGHPLLLG